MVVVLVHGGGGASSTSSRPLDPAARDFVPSSSSPSRAASCSSSSSSSSSHGPITTSATTITTSPTTTVTTTPSLPSSSSASSSSSADKYRAGGADEAADVDLHLQHGIPLTASWTLPSSSPSSASSSSSLSSRIAPDPYCPIIEQSDFLQSNMEAAAVPILALPEHQHHHHQQQQQSGASDYSQQHLQMISMAAAGAELYQSQLPAAAAVTNHYVNFVPAALVQPPAASPSQSPAVFLHHASMVSEQWEGANAGVFTSYHHGAGHAQFPIHSAPHAPEYQNQYFCRYPSPPMAHGSLLPPMVQSPAQQVSHHHLQQRSLLGFSVNNMQQQSMSASSLQQTHPHVISSSSSAAPALPVVGMMVRPKRDALAGARERMSRALQLVGVPVEIKEEELLRELSAWGDVRAVQTEKKAEGLVTVHFFDIRCAKSALTDIQHQHLLQQQRVQKQLLLQQSLRQPTDDAVVRGQAFVDDGENVETTIGEGSVSTAATDGEAVAQSSIGCYVEEADDDGSIVLVGMVAGAETAVEERCGSSTGDDGKGMIGGRAIWAHYTIPVDLQTDDCINQGTLVVFNLEVGTQADEVRAIFEKYGPVKEVREAPLRRQHKFVEFFDVRDAASALHALDGSEVQEGKKMKIEFSRPVGTGRKQQLSSATTAAVAARAQMASLSPSHRHHIDPSRTSTNLVHVGLPSFLHNKGMICSGSSAMPACMSSETANQSIPSIYWGWAAPEACSLWPGGASTTSAAALPSSCGSYGSASLLPAPLLAQLPPAMPATHHQIAYAAAAAPLEMEAGASSSSSSSAVMAMDQVSVPPPLAYPVGDHPSSFSFRSGIRMTPPRHSSSNNVREPQQSQNVHGIAAACTTTTTYSGRWSSAASKRVLQQHQQHVSDGCSESWGGVGGEAAAPPLQHRTTNLRKNNNIIIHAGRSGNSSSSSSWRLAASTSNVGSSSLSSMRSSNKSAGSSSSSQDQYKFDESEALAAAAAAAAASSSSASPGRSAVADSGCNFCNIRTTLMIRNIPNKYTQQMLISMLDDHCLECNSSLIADDSGSSSSSEPLSAFDFVYLPIDFKNRCNLGYAFVNLTSPQATIRLHKAFHGRQWDEFNSRKICEVTYARLQGREALEDHFKNSRFACDTDEYLPVVFSPPRGGIRAPSPATTEPQGPSTVSVDEGCESGGAAGADDADKEEQGSSSAGELPEEQQVAAKSYSAERPDNFRVDNESSLDFIISSSTSASNNNTANTTTSISTSSMSVGIALGRRLTQQQHHHHYHHQSYRYAGILPHQPR